MKQKKDADNHSVCQYDPLLCLSLAFQAFSKICMQFIVNLHSFEKLGIYLLSTRQNSAFISADFHRIAFQIHFLIVKYCLIPLALTPRNVCSVHWRDIVYILWIPCGTNYARCTNDIHPQAPCIFPNCS